MKITFDSYDEYLTLHQSIHDSIIHWKKIYQMTQGLINMNVDGGPTHYTSQEAIDMMVTNALLLKSIEDAPHPDWTEDGDEVIVDGCENSHIVTQTLKRFGDKVS